MTPTPAARPKLAERAAFAFASLRYRDFRFLLLSTTSLGFGQWFQQIGMGWLAYIVTRSPIQIGIVAAIRGVSVVVVSIPAGMLADRYDRRTLVLWATAASALQAGLLASLVIFGVVQWWHLWLFALVEGSLAAFNMPARNALVYDQVGPKTLENAIALTALSQNLARITGPTIAGGIIAWLGVGVCFLALAGLKVIAFALTIPMRPAIPNSGSEQRAKGWRGYVEGMVVVARSRILLGLLLMQVLSTMLVYPYLAFVPIYVSEVLGLGDNASAYGFLMSGIGFGSLVGAALLAAMGSGKRGGMIMLCGGWLYMAMIMLFSQSTWLPLSFGFLVLAGLVNVFKTNLNQIFYQLHTPNEARGRVLAVYGMTTGGLQPVGNLVIGPVIGGWGFSNAITAFTALAALMVVVLVAVIPELWRLHAPSAKAREEA